MPKETSPVSDRGITLLNSSFERVAETFSGFKSAGERGLFIQRGGIRRIDKKPRIVARHYGDSQDHQSRYHIESSFNPDQLAYVGLCVAGLNKLARGGNFLHKEANLPTLSNQIQSRFLSHAGTRLRFGDSVAASTVSLFY